MSEKSCPCQKCDGTPSYQLLSSAKGEKVGAPKVISRWQSCVARTPVFCGCLMHDQSRSIVTSGVNNPKKGQNTE